MCGVEGKCTLCVAKKAIGKETTWKTQVLMVGLC